jgi:hypothetical protein
MGDFFFKTQPQPLQFEWVNERIDLVLLDNLFVRELNM